MQFQIDNDRLLFVGYSELIIFHMKLPLSFTIDVCVAQLSSHSELLQNKLHNSKTEFNLITKFFDS